MASPATESEKENSFESSNIEDERNLSNLKDNVNKKEYQNERSIFYKKPIKKDNYKLSLDFHETPQEIRRQRILHYQKLNREACIDVARGLLGDVLNPENEGEMEVEEESCEMEVDETYNEIRRDYARMFMLSEWMSEVPQDFGDKWIMVPCPLGQRVLVVAYKGITKLFTRRGFRVYLFKTFLPGGNPNNTKNSCTILDGIWMKERKICYVLDVLVWSNQEMLNCDTAFRFYWLKSRMEERDKLKEVIPGVNERPVLSLPTVDCNQDFYECLQSVSTLFPLDGILFYHKEAHYTSGKTPLVTWLKAYMLPEVLGVNVPEPYNEKPNSYIDFQQHMLIVNQIEREKIERKRKKRQCCY